MTVGLVMSVLWALASPLLDDDEDEEDDRNVKR
eukprot:CAMPEP_0117059744 /NCGR_PEP_ID=MMETSP0472-20121206/41533_1 /TAXON_ID=693140 ORGANISM="Tiarina fusus, Strain LIS" /NCGR_SAMPLE_ID=MMETSP0472 /ASSEMBLY_ACC=CAM_ASM_000603 /LENGTH=32 /DNA_ID= /DNA_START= /DNA_END= /DNA_ORIENTATION=